jgi:hypothetical protein
MVEFRTVVDFFQQALFVRIRGQVDDPHEIVVKSPFDLTCIGKGVGSDHATILPTEDIQKKHPLF